MVIALIALWVGDHSLNLLTLGGLTIAVGRVVDDSIVVLENIKRHLEYGEPSRTAILTAVREVSGAVTASTLTTVAVFAPIAVVGGMVGELFAPFAITVTVALLASLLVSLTVIPVLAYWFLRVPAVTDADKARAVREQAEAKELRSPLQRAYLPVLRFATRHRLITVLAGIVVFVTTMGLAGRLETNFIDSSGQDTIQISQRMPAGTDLATTDAAAAKVEQLLAAQRGVQSYQVTIGSGGAMFGGGGGGTDRASYSVTVAPGVDSAELTERLRQKVATLTGVGEITVGVQQGGGMSTDIVQVIVQAPDGDTLATAAETVRAAMTRMSELRDVTSNLEASAPRIEVRVDREEAARAGLTEAAIGQAVAQAFRGTPLGQITLSEQTAELVLRGEDTPGDLEEVRDLELPTASGTVKLSKVADVERVDGPVQVTRIDGERSATVSGVVAASDLGSVTATLTTELEKLPLPPGASYTIGGVVADQQEAFADLGLAMLAAIAIVFMIMVATFRSFVQPLILLVSIPFAATGAVGLLLITGTPLGVPAWRSATATARERSSPAERGDDGEQRQRTRPARDPGPGARGGARQGHAGLGQGGRLLRGPAPDHPAPPGRAAGGPADARADQGLVLRGGRWADAGRRPDRRRDPARHRRRADDRSVDPARGRVRGAQVHQAARPAAADRGAGRRGPLGARRRGHLDHGRIGAGGARRGPRGRRHGRRGRGGGRPGDRGEGGDRGGGRAVPGAARPRRSRPRLSAPAEQPSNLPGFRPS